MNNLEKYRSLLNDEVQGLFLTSRYSRMYAAEFDISEGYAIVGKEGARYFTDSRYIEAAQKSVKNCRAQKLTRVANEVNDYIKENNIQKAG